MTRKKHDSKQAHRMFNFGNWHMTFRPFFGFLSQAEANLLCLLINQQERWGKRQESEDEEWDPDKWFYCKAKTIYYELFMPERTQKRLIEKLEAKKLITVEVRGFPPKRWFKINYTKLQELVEKTFLKVARMREADKVKRRKKS